MSYLYVALFLTVIAWVFAYRSWFNIGEEFDNLLNSMGASTLSLFFYFYWNDDRLYLSLISYFPKGGGFIVLAGMCLLWVTMPVLTQILFMNKDGEVSIKNFLANLKNET